jgi:hypothetical protein
MQRHGGHAVKARQTVPVRSTGWLDEADGARAQTAGAAGSLSMCVVCQCNTLIFIKK